MATLPALVLQPAFHYMLSAYPDWTHYIHYLVFAGIGAALAKK
jgi:hypothetical protein